MSCRGVLPKLDAAVFADTQWEPKAVYKHLAWLEVEAKSYGIPVLRGTRGDLRADAIEFRRTGSKAQGAPGGKRHASMPLFVKNPNSDQEGRINRQCTSEYKIKVIEKIIRRDLLGLKQGQVAPANAVEQWFGISADEVQRMRRSANHWSVFRYPLIKDAISPKRDQLFARGFDRQDCKDWLAKMGYPEPPRSACIGCPFHSDEEWLRMRREDPEAWEDAVAFDRDSRAASSAIAGRLVGLPFLHRSCVPLEQVQFKPKDKQAAFTYGMQNECFGMCGV
jgi:hypothetical protein